MTAFEINKIVEKITYNINSFNVLANELLGRPDEPWHKLCGMLSVLEAVGVVYSLGWDYSNRFITCFSVPKFSIDLVF